MVATPNYIKVLARTEDARGFAIEVAIVPAMSLPSDFDNAYATRHTFRVDANQAGYYPPGKVYRLGIIEE